MFYNIEKKKKKREGFKHLSSFFLFNRFSFLYLYSYISIGRKCSNVRISSPFPSSIILHFFSHSSHAIHLLPNLTENKEREEKRKEKPDAIHLDENGETVSDRFKRYPTILLTATTNLHSEMAGNHQSYSPRFQNSPGDGTNKIQQRFNEDVWRNGGCGTSSRSFQRVPIRGSWRTKLSPKWKKGKADKSGGRRLILNRYQVPGGFRCLRRDTFPRSSFGWSRRGEEGTQRPTVTDCVMRSYPTGRSRFLAGTVAGMVSLGTCSANKLPFVLET